MHVTVAVLRAWKIKKSKFLAASYLNATDTPAAVDSLYSLEFIYFALDLKITPCKKVKEVEGYPSPDENQRIGCVGEERHVRMGHSTPRNHTLCLGEAQIECDVGVNRPCLSLISITFNPTCHKEETMVSVHQFVIITIGVALEVVRPSALLMIREILSARHNVPSGIHWYYTSIGCINSVVS